MFYQGGFTLHSMRFCPFSSAFLLRTEKYAHFECASECKQYTHVRILRCAQKRLRKIAVRNRVEHWSTFCPFSSKHFLLEMDSLEASGYSAGSVLQFRSDNGTFYDISTWV